MQNKSFAAAVIMAAVLMALAAAPRTVDKPVETYSEISYTAGQLCTVEVVTETAPVQLYDVPLSDELQIQMQYICAEYGIEFKLLLAMMQVESDYCPDAVGDNGKSFGLLQIQPQWWQSYMDKLNCPDLLDPLQNVRVGCAILRYMYDSYTSTFDVLQGWNTGDPTSNNGYALRVFEAMDKLKER